MSILFEWDGLKAAVNLRKHAVAFEEAASVFGDSLARIFDDEHHSSEEDREIIIGHSSGERLLVISLRLEALVDSDLRREKSDQTGAPRL